MFRAHFISVLALVLALGATPVSGQSRRLENRQQVIALKIAEGEPDDPGRVFCAPVECNGHEADFPLNCLGPSRISESFAEECGAEVMPDAQLKRVLAADGKPEYAGYALVHMRFAGREQRLQVPVMKDEYCPKVEKQGVLGMDLIRPFQWEVDPTVPSLTLRPLGTPPAHKPLAIIPLQVNVNGYFATVKVRNATASLALMPGASFVQAGANLQRQWDLNSGEPIKSEVKRFSGLRLYWFKGEDTVELNKDLKETNLNVALVGDPKHPGSKLTIDSGLGQCVLNRFVYCVDGRKGQLRIMARVPERSGAAATPASSHETAATRPAPGTDHHSSPTSSRDRSIP